MTLLIAATMTQNKYHWYDGYFYDKIIAPNQDKLFGQIKNLIEPNSNVIDIGCGTGRLEFVLSDKCKSALGIDLSKRNIDRANLSLLRHPDVKISFKHNNLREITSGVNVHFDYAILTYVIHEVNEDERLDILIEVSRVADKIIIGDYLVPRPKWFGGFLSELIEFIAGKEHYRNYKSYMANGGIFYLADKAGLKAIDEITNHSLSNHIVVLAK
jgi:ubiquinone/menaquinone biosynthesis C-methylase UbiE